MMMMMMTMVEKGGKLRHHVFEHGHEFAFERFGEIGSMSLITEQVDHFGFKFTLGGVTFEKQCIQIKRSLVALCYQMLHILFTQRRQMLSVVGIEWSFNEIRERFVGGDWCGRFAVQYLLFNICCHVGFDKARLID